MLPMVFQLPKAVVSAAAAFGLVSIYCLYRMYYHLLGFYLSDDSTLCGAESNWDLSLGNDCFRIGFVWPTILLLFGAASALFFCLCLVLPTKSTSEFTSDGSSPFSRLSVGNMLVPVRRPPGQTVVVDNRLRIGICTVILLAIQTALNFTWKYSSPNSEENSLKDDMYSCSMAQLSAVVLLFSFICLSFLWHSNRMTYAGLFPSVLPAAVGLQFISGLCEMYFSFFTDKNSNVPIIGTDASTYSNLLSITTAISLLLLLLFSFVQWRPVFYRSFGTAPNNSLSSTYISLQEVGNSIMDDDTTPLSHMNDQKSSELIDTPEQNCSWFDKVTFSWIKDLLNRRAKTEVDYHDLYNINSSHMPVTNWKRYLRYRKPGRSLFATILLAFSSELFIHFLLTIVRCILEFSGSFFLQRIVRSIEASQDSLPIANSRSKYLDVVGLLTFTIISSTTYNYVLWSGRCFAIRLKGLLVAELTSKSLRRHGKGLSNGVAKPSNGNEVDNNLKEDAADTDGKAMNILTADFQTVAHASAYLHNMYSPIITLTIGIWYMYKILGVSALIGLGISAIYMYLSKVLLLQNKKLKVLQSMASDKRLAAIKDVLQGIQIIKLFGWESRFLHKVDKLCETQLAYAWKRLLWFAFIGASAALNPIIILIVMFTLYVVVFGNALSAETAFTSIGIFQIVREAIDYVPTYINLGVTGYVSITRIDSYLQQPQIQDLEERISLSGSNNELGFASADLEWGVSNDTSNTANTSSNSSNVSGNTISNDNGQPLESTPLLSGSSNSQIAQTDNQENIRRFSLKNIDVRFPLGELSIVAGPTGSGKTSLLSALVGEMTLVSGCVLLPTIHPSALAEINSRYKDVIELSNEGLSIHNIAYVAQEAWLRNATIRDNILFGEPYNRERYEEVLRVCALKPDLRNLPAADMSEVGERGITLSGGQKQRVALARAVYSSRRILLIDDCLSAVDAQTGKHILVECLAGNSKLMYGRTRVLVTHHVAMCLPYAQYMVIMNNGRIMIQGTPEELRDNAALSSALTENLSSKEILPGEEKYKDKHLSKSVNDRKSEDQYNKEHLQKLAVKRGIDPDADHSVLQGILVKEEEREKGYVKLEVWKTFIQACGGNMFWIYLISILIVGEATTALRSYWIKLWVASTTSPATGLDIYNMEYHTAALNIHKDISVNNMTMPSHRSSTYWLGFYALLGFASAAWSMLILSSTYAGQLRAVRVLHEKLIRKIIHAAPRFLESTPIGRIINRFSRDMDIIEDKSLTYTMRWLNYVANVLAIYLVVSIAVPTFYIAAIITTVAFIVVAFDYLDTSRELNRLESNSNSPLLSLFSEIIQGKTTIRAFGAKHYYIKEAINCINKPNRPFYAMWSANRWLDTRVSAMSAILSAIAASLILFNNKIVDAGMAGFVLSYSMSFSASMVDVVRYYNMNEMNMNAVERIMQYMDIDQEAPLESDSANKPAATWPNRGDVKIENLVVEYVPGVPVLHGVSLSVEHGKKIGVVGRTGAGKSTISLALLRFIEASKGRIVLDGVDISKIGLEDLRRNVTIIPQDPVLFNGTIRFNLDPFGEHPDELLWDALSRTHLLRSSDVHCADLGSSAIKDTENGESNDMVLDRMAGIFTSLDAEIKENGQNISAGQRQLVALARALVRRSKLIIMDEATASVDFDTDNRIQRTVRGPEFANSTLFCIAHRLRTIIDYDKVLVLNDGKVAEFDTPHNLLQTEKGIFRHMCEKSGEYKHLIKLASSHR